MLEDFREALRLLVKRPSSAASRRERDQKFASIKNLGACVVVLASSLAFAQDLVISDVAVVDVVQGTVIPHQDVRIRDGLIAEVASTASVNDTPVVDDGDVVDASDVEDASDVIAASGLFLTPGL